MDRYDNYNPEILYHEELPPVEAPKDNTPDPKPSKKERSRKNTSAKKGNTASRAKKENADNRPFSQRAAEWFSSSTFRFIIGILLGGFGIYLAVAFFSFFSSCIDDQALIDNSAVGAARGIGNQAGGGVHVSPKFISTAALASVRLSLSSG